MSSGGGPQSRTPWPTTVRYHRSSTARTGRVWQRSWCIPIFGCVGHDCGGISSAKRPPPLRPRPLRPRSGRLTSARAVADVRGRPVKEACRGICPGVSGRRLSPPGRPTAPRPTGSPQRTKRAGRPHGAGRVPRPARTGQWRSGAHARDRRETADGRVEEELQEQVRVVVVDPDPGCAGVPAGTSLTAAGAASVPPRCRVGGTARQPNWPGPSAGRTAGIPEGLWTIRPWRAVPVGPAHSSACPPGAGRNAQRAPNQTSTSSVI